MHTTTQTLATLTARHGIDVLDHLDQDVTVPILTGLQRQGDVIIVPNKKAAAKITVPATGVPVVKGENGGNTHAILAEGTVYCDTRQATTRDLTLALLTIPAGSIAYLAHPEHGYMGIGPGSYTIRRQREQADELRIVTD